MTTNTLLPRNRYQPLLLLATFSLAVALATRVALLLEAHQTISSWSLLSALAVGEVYDLLTSLWLAVPALLFLTALPERWFRARAAKILLRIWLFAAIGSLLFIAIAEGFFFSEFNSRFNFVAVDYLMYPTEVVNNIWESYPTGSILAGLAILALAVLVVFEKALRRSWETPVRLPQRAGVFGGYLAVLAVLTLAVSPALAHVSADRELNEIASNGYYSFWMSLLGSNAPYQGMYATRDQAVVVDRLHRLLAEPAAVPASFEEGSTRRHIRAVAPTGRERRMNVVVVLEESLGSELVGTLHPRPVSLTPEFDALTREGTLLTNAYSTGNRTIRAIEATTSSLPPLPGISIVRRPQSRDLFTLPELLRHRGYQTLFVYGGRALFDGMGRYLRQNGVERIVEQKDFPDDTFATAWGVADEAIFDRALTEMDGMQSQGRPFYTLILSVSNHRPFHFPENEIRPDPSLRARENAVRYADHALGRFLRQARGHAFFGNTLFVLMGDHGARVYGAAEIPLASYQVPILFYAPGLIPAGRRVDTLASSMDIPPTLLGLLGAGYDSKFFGHDIFRIAPSEGRALMNHNNEIALMRGGRMAILGLHESTSLFDVGADGALSPVPAPDRAGRELIEDAVAYYGGADLEYRTGAYAFTGSQGERLAAASGPPAHP